MTGNITGGRCRDRLRENMLEDGLRQWHVEIVSKDIIRISGNNHLWMVKVAYVSSQGT